MSSTAKIDRIYTDGACSGNPGPGGWGVVVYQANGAVHELGGYEPQTTNNRMELQAAIAALEYYNRSGQREPMTLYTDSEYVKNGITKWIQGWKRKGWKTSTGKAVLNQDLWEQLDALHSARVTWQYVRGHAGDEGNERCDAIARAFALGKSPALRQAVADPNPPLSTESTLGQSSEATNVAGSETLESTYRVAHSSASSQHGNSMNDSTASTTVSDTFDNLPREVRVAQLRHLIETLHMADEVANQGYLITSAELADLMDVNASAVTSRGDNWVWRNWMVSRVRREGNQILWQLERVD